MRGIFDDREPEPAPSRNETEVTLGSGMLLAIFFGLVLVCGLCFGLGYAVGRRGSPPASASAQLQAGAPTDLQTDSAHPKPSPTASTGLAPAAQGGPDGLPAPGDSSANPGTRAQNSIPAPQAASSYGQSQVRPALLPSANPGQPAQPAGSKATPALGQTVPLMVQIAAVSQQEDADVLVGALRKRGYSVTVRRDPSDGLLHVRIGPFSGSAEAEKWRQKLLGDGYNAIVQQ
jgi:cell division protein FtsN